MATNVKESVTVLDPRAAAIEECISALEKLADYAASAPHWSDLELDGILLSIGELEELRAK